MGPHFGPSQLTFFSSLFLTQQGRTSEHHLWVVSGKDEPAYPLIGKSPPMLSMILLLNSGTRGNSNKLY